MHLSIHITVEFFNKRKHKSLMAKAKMSTHLLVSHNKALTKTRVSGILHKSPQSGVLEDENATAHLASTCKGPTTYL